MKFTGREKSGRKSAAEKIQIERGSCAPDSVLISRIEWRATTGLMSDPPPLKFIAASKCL